MAELRPALGAPVIHTATIAYEVLELPRLPAGPKLGCQMLATALKALNPAPAQLDCVGNGRFGYRPP